MAKTKLRVCGHCAGAARTHGNPTVSHARCATTLGTNDPRWPCACGAADHKFDVTLAEHFARYCHLDVDAIYARHGRKRRVLTDEQRTAAAARLAQARVARSNKQGTSSDGASEA